MNSKLMNLLDEFIKKDKYKTKDYINLFQSELVENVVVWTGETTKYIIKRDGEIEREYKTMNSTYDKEAFLQLPNRKPKKIEIKLKYHPKWLDSELENLKYFYPAIYEKERLTIRINI